MRRKNKRRRWGRIRRRRTRRGGRDITLASAGKVKTKEHLLGRHYSCVTKTRVSQYTEEEEKHENGARRSAKTTEKSARTARRGGSQSGETRGTYEEKTGSPQVPPHGGGGVAECWRQQCLYSLR